MKELTLHQFVNNFCFALECCIINNVFTILFGSAKGHSCYLIVHPDRNEKSICSVSLQLVFAMEGSPGSFRLEAVMSYEPVLALKRLAGVADATVHANPPYTVCEFNTLVRLGQPVSQQHVLSPSCLFVKFTSRHVY